MVDKLVIFVVKLTLIIPVLCDSQIDDLKYPTSWTLDYRMVVGRKAVDWYFQPIQENASLYVLMEVLSGGDENCGFYVTQPNGSRVFAEESSHEAEYETDLTTRGSYGLCIDNSAGSFARLVHIYIQIWRPGTETDQEAEKSEELENLEIQTQSFKRTLAGIERRITSMARHLYHSSAMERRDYTLLLYNNFIVAFWAFVQCLFVILATSCQVYFVRRLFQSPKYVMV